MTLRTNNFEVNYSKTLTHLSLFTGIGGMDLAAEMAGFITVGQCENAAYPTKVLQRHWPLVPKWSDVEELTGASFYERTGIRTVNIISGGIPCQPFSVAGKQKGQGDNRYLWPQMFRVIRELAPRWVIVENVSGIVKIAGDTICKDLEQAGYSVGIFNYEVAAIGAPHRRARVFFVGNAEHNGLFTAKVAGGVDSSSGNVPKGTQETGEFTGASKPADYVDVAHADNGRGSMWRYWKLPTVESAERWGDDIGGRAPEYVAGQRGPIESRVGRMVDGFSNWLYEPNIPRISTGVKNRVERLKCLGNAVVPQQAYPIFAAIAEILKNER